MRTVFPVTSCIVLTLLVFVLLLLKENATGYGRGGVMISCSSESPLLEGRFELRVLHKDDTRSFHAFVVRERLAALASKRDVLLLDLGPDGGRPDVKGVIGGIGSILGLAPAAGEGLLLAARSGAYALRSGTLSTVARLPVVCAAEVEEGVMWLGGPEGVFVVPCGDTTALPLAVSSFDDFPPTRRITCICRSRDGRLWLGSEYGLHCLEGGRWKRLLAEREYSHSGFTDFRAATAPLCGNVINRLRPDGHSGLLVATDRGGSILGEAAETFSGRHFLYGTEHERLCRLVVDGNTGLVFGAVRDMLRWDGITWLATDHGLVAVRGGPGDEKKACLVLRAQVNALALARAGLLLLLEHSLALLGRR